VIFFAVFLILVSYGPRIICFISKLIWILCRCVLKREFLLLLPLETYGSDGSELFNARSLIRIQTRTQWKVDRVTANHSLSSTASQGTSNIPFPCFLVLGCNRQAQRIMKMNYFLLIVTSHPKP
jgi:hypothetical protein